MAKLFRNKKLMIILSCVLVVVIVAVILIVNAVGNSGKEVSLYDVELGTVSSALNTSGDVESSNRAEYRVSSSATVQEVFVRTGDQVTEGQLLATFDTSELDEQIASQRQTYNQYRQSYNEAVQASREAQSNLAAVEQEIAEVERQIANASSGSSDSSNAELEAVVNQAVSGAVASGATSEEEIMAAVQKAVNDAFASGQLTGVDMNDLNDLLSSSSSTDLLSGLGGDTLSLELSLMTLQIQRQMYEASSSDALISTNQSLMEASASTLDSLTEQRDALADGWTADFDGLITEVNIEAGQDTSLLSTGIVLEGNAQMVVAITLGKYDIQKVETGMQCIITVPNGEYQGEVTYIAPTAGSSSSGDLMDSLGSMMGMSGLGSLTGSSSGLRAEITVRNPDDKMVIGLDANVEIILGTQENVVVIPIESLRLEKEGTFCFVYDEETDTVEKRELTVGSTSDTLYEVADGLRVGEKIVAAPTSDLEDGDQVKVTNS